MTKVEESKELALQPNAVEPEHKRIALEFDVDKPASKFKKGDSVVAHTITFNNGVDGALSAVYWDAIVFNSPYDGVAYNGYLWPRTSDLHYEFGYKQINPDLDKPDEYYHEPLCSKSKDVVLHFEKGSNVSGYKLSFSNGKTFYGASIRNSPYSGTVSNGTIWLDHSANSWYMLPIVDPDKDQPWPRNLRQVYTNQYAGDTLPFEKGDNFYGDLVRFSNGVEVKDAAVINSPLSGTVSGGGLHSSEAEIHSILKKFFWLRLLDPRKDIFEI